jgi:hypothetical protein
MTKEKLQNKVQTIQWPKKKYKIKYRQSNDKRKRTKKRTDNQMTKKKYNFIWYFFFGHWIVCTLFCTFSLVIGLSVLYFVLFL